MYGSLFFWIVFDFPVFSKTGLCLPDLDAENGSLTLFAKAIIPLIPFLRGGMAPF